MMLFLFFASGYYADAIRTANEYVYFSHVPDSCLRPIDLYTHLTCIYICRDRRGWVHGECHGPLRL